VLGAVATDERQSDDDRAKPSRRYFQQTSADATHCVTMLSMACPDKSASLLMRLRSLGVARHLIALAFAPPPPLL
jgi:hypothetical protein